MEGTITPDSLLYTRFAREERKLTSLIEDARQNPLVKTETAAGTVYVKDVAILTARQHMLVIPDQPSGVLMGNVQEVPLPLLGDTLRVAGDIATYYESQPKTKQVDVMINFSTDPLKGIQTQPNLHVHILGFGPDDIQRPTNRREMRANPELRPQENEPLNSVIYDLLDQQVFPSVAKDPAFSRLFERTSDEHGAITYRLIHGDATFSDSDFPRVMQEIHERSQEVYNQLASAYFEMDKDKGTFIEEADGRYELLPQEERIKNVATYISEHPNLSSASQRWLQFLASHATDLENVVTSKERAKKSELSPQERRYVINRFAAIKALAYGCTFSGIKTDDKYDWRMGYDPIVFSTRGTLAASRGTQKAAIMDSTRTYDQQTLEIVKASERKLGEYLVEKGKQDSSLPYQPGSQLAEKLSHSQFLEAQEKVLNDRPSQPVDAALFFGRSWFDAEKTGVYQLMKDFYDQGTIKYIVLYGSDGQKFGDTVPDVVGPGKRFARDRLVKMGVPNERILDSELEDPTKNNTLEEGRGMINLVRARGWNRVVAVANAHQLLRATLGLVQIIDNPEGTRIDLWTAAPHDTNWNKRVRGAQGEHLGPRSEHVDRENERVRTYQAKGDIASFDQYFAYIQNRGQGRKIG